MKKIIMICFAVVLLVSSAVGGVYIVRSVNTEVTVSAQIRSTVNAFFISILLVISQRLPEYMCSRHSSV